MPASLTPEEQKYIKGVQANLWTEYILSLIHIYFRQDNIEGFFGNVCIFLIACGQT